METQSHSYDNLIAGNFPLIDRKVTLLMGQNLAKGTLVGLLSKVIGTPTYAGNTGNGQLAPSPGIGKASKLGTYKLVCTAAAANGGTFKVVDPDEELLDSATVGVAYVGDHLNFTIQDGGTDFIVGDTILVPVIDGSNKAKICDSTNTDGSHIPEGILSEACDATSGDKQCIIWLTGEFNEDKLVFGGSDTKETFRRILRMLGIHLRKVV